MVVPRGIGGSELDFPTYVQVIEEIGKADASTGWAVNQGGDLRHLRRPHAARRGARDLDRHAAQRGGEHPGADLEGRGGAGRLSRHRPPALQHRLPARLLDRRERSDHRERRSEAEERPAGSALFPDTDRARSSCSTRGTRAACAARGPITSRSRTSSCRRSARSSRGARRSRDRRPALQDSAHAGIRGRRRRRRARPRAQLHAMRSSSWPARRRRAT